MKKVKENVKMQKERNQLNLEMKETRGITLIALVITTIFSYDENIKCSNSKGFLLQAI